MAENLVFLILKQKYEEIFYWKGKNEVDFVIPLPDRRIILINVSYSDEALEAREFKGFKEFRLSYPEMEIDSLILTKNQSGVQNQVSLQILWQWILDF